MAPELFAVLNNAWAETLKLLDLAFTLFAGFGLCCIAVCALVRAIKSLHFRGQAAELAPNRLEGALDSTLEKRRGGPRP